MQKVLDKNLFLVYTASYIVFYPDFKRTIDTLYQKQKFRFYEKAKTNPCYNHSFFVDGSLEREVACKRAFGILLCAEEDESLKKTIVQSMIAARPELKILQDSFDDSHLGKIIQGFATKYDLAEESNSFLYFLIYISLSQDIKESNIITHIYNNLSSDIESREVYTNKNVLARIENCNINKVLIIPNYVKDAISFFTDNSRLECLLDITEKNLSSPISRRLADIFDNCKEEGAFADLTQACLHCHRVSEMLSVHGLSFVMLYNGREYNKRDREFILKTLVDSLRFDNGKYQVKFSDFVQFLLLDGLSKTYVESKKFYSLNNSETQYNELSRLEKTLGELTKTIDNLNDSLSLEKSFTKKLQEQIQILNEENSRDFKDAEKSLLREISLLKAQNDELQKKLDKEEEKNNELHKLREFVFGLQQSELKEVDTPNLSELIKGKRIFIIGGHINWRNKLSSKYPSLHIVDGHNTSFDSSKLFNADIVFLNTANMSHALYYKIIDDLRDNKVNFSYLGKYMNQELLEQEILEHLQLLS